MTSVSLSFIHHSFIHGASRVNMLMNKPAVGTEGEEGREVGRREGRAGWRGREKAAREGGENGG